MPMHVAFRNTLGHVTDAPGTHAELLDFGSPANYPTVAPWGLNVGWSLVTNLDSFNGNPTNDPRIAGGATCDESQYKIQLPAAGTYPITVAMGHPTSAVPASFEIVDTSTSLGFPIPPLTTTNGGQRFRDIENIDSAAADWPLIVRSANFTFSTAVAKFVFPAEAGATVAHISIGDAIFPVRAVVDYRDMASTGGASLSRVVYAVTFIGANVSEEVATQRQLEIVVEMESDFTVAERRTAITEAVQVEATKLGLTVVEVDILSLGEVTPQDQVFDTQVSSDIAVGTGQGGFYFDLYNQLLITKDQDNRARGYTDNASIGVQSVAGAADVYITGSDLRFPSFGAQAKMRFEWKISFSKTAAGIAAPIYKIFLGSTRGTSDPLVLTLTGPAQTAVTDLGTLTVWGTIRASGASGIIQATAEWTHKGQTGFANNVDGHVDGTSAAFNLGDVKGLYLGLSVNSGTAGNWTASQAWGQAWW
jgi:hypothetical protein